MKPNDKLPGEQNMLSDKAPSSLDRDVGEEESTNGQCNLYQEMSDTAESSRENHGQEARRSEPSTQRTEMTSRSTNDESSRESKFHAICTPNPLVEVPGDSTMGED